MQRSRTRCTRTTRRAATPAIAVTSLHTLGPAGTNCELAARRWFARAGVAGQVVLHESLEAAARAAVSTPGGALLVPAAYPEFHTLVYSHLTELVLADALVMPTHAMVLARRAGVTALDTVACHPAPVALVPEGARVRPVSSNAQAAADCAAGLADACITTGAAQEAFGLELVRDFGPVEMAFTVHIRQGERLRHYDPAVPSHG